MSLVRDIVSIAFLLAGTGFFVVGTIGILRLPDLFTRLHALTKADNLGLGLVVLALALRAGSVMAALKLVLIWLLVLLASSSTSYLMARAALRNGIRPWKAP